MAQKNEIATDRTAAAILKDVKQKGVSLNCIRLFYSYIEIVYEG